MDLATLDSGFSFDLDKGECLFNGRKIHLSQKELLIAEYLFCRKNVIVSREEITLLVWGARAKSAPLDNTISSLRRKMERGCLKRMVYTAKNKGLVWIE